MSSVTDIGDAPTSMFRRATALALKAASKVKRSLFPKRDYVIHKGSRLPAPELRFNGALYKDDEFYLSSAIKEANRVIAMGYSPSDSLVEIGCGHSRLAMGLVRQFENARYLGLDVFAPCIDWCKTHIEERNPSYRFQHINIVNERYNPQGQSLPQEFNFPVQSGSADIVYLWGVVSNMEPKHLVPYVSEISRMLRRGGKAFLTCNVEDNVPLASTNPENYTPFELRGPLHIVRYEREHFMNVFRTAGLKLLRLDHHAAGDCQSEVYFVKE